MGTGLQDCRVARLQSRESVSESRGLPSAMDCASFSARSKRSEREVDGTQQKLKSSGLWSL
jgi:hypothetical protein